MHKKITTKSPLIKIIILLGKSFAYSSTVSTNDTLEYNNLGKNTTQLLQKLQFKINLG